MATLASIRLENRTYAQTFTANVLTPVVFTQDALAYAQGDTAWQSYFSFGSFPLTDITIVQQSIFLITAGVTMGTITTTGMYTVMIQRLPYKASSWITIAAHTVIGSVNDAGSIKVSSCQVVQRLQQNDTIRVCAISPLNNVTIALAQNSATGSMFPYITLTRALI